MTSISKNNSKDEYMEAADAIHNLIVQLVNDDINAGYIASCLTMHATRLSLQRVIIRQLFLETF